MLDLIYRTATISPLTGDAIRAQVGVQLVGEGEQLAEGLVGTLGEGHAALRRLAGQQAALPRGLARLTLWGEFLYQVKVRYDTSKDAPSDPKLVTRFQMVN